MNRVHIYDFDDNTITCCAIASTNETYHWGLMRLVTCHACLKAAAMSFDENAQRLRDRQNDVALEELKKVLMEAVAK